MTAMLTEPKRKTVGKAEEEGPLSAEELRKCMPTGELRTTCPSVRST
jgi:hypothetical protein